MNRRGITLVETLAVIVLMAAIAPVLGHLLASASGSIATTTAARDAADDVGYALRIMHTTLSDDLALPGTAIDAATEDEIRLSTGLRIRLDAEAVLLTKSGLPESPLVRGVTDFELVYDDADGVQLPAPLDADDRQRVARIGIRVDARGIELACRVYSESSRTYPEAAALGPVEPFNCLPNGGTWHGGELVRMTDAIGPGTYAQGAHDARRFVPRVRTPERTEDVRPTQTASATRTRSHPALVLTIKTAIIQQSAHSGARA